MDRSDWAALLVQVLFSLLSEYMRKHGHDEAQEVVSQVSANLALTDLQPQLDWSSKARVTRVSDNPILPVTSLLLPSSTSKAEYRRLQGTVS